MSNMSYIFIAMLVLSNIMVLIGGKNKTAKQSDSAKEWWYLTGLVGCFGLLSNYMSFTALLLLFVVISGGLWIVDKLFLAKKHIKDKNNFICFVTGIFPIILCVFILRSFIVEPFQIPSSSMRPGLVVGDFILVNKFTYGIRIPVLNNVIIPVNKVSRGDVVVFNYPPNPKVDFIKRVIGLPGDTIEYENKILKVNGQVMPKISYGIYKYIDENNKKNVFSNQQFKEKFSDKSFYVLNQEQRPPIDYSQVINFKYRDNCHYDDNGFVCKVPQGHYFMMGDNRDNSLDGRYWGFVDDKLLVGKAFFVWMNFHDFGRIGHIIN